VIASPTVARPEAVSESRRLLFVAAEDEPGSESVCNVMILSCAVHGAICVKRGQLVPTVECNACSEIGARDWCVISFWSET